MSINNQRLIARNTAILYFRLLLTMVVSLYTSRIILTILGVEDFGIYNVVGGFVLMLGFLNTAMAASTQRFFSFEIGRRDFLELANVFNMSVNIHFLIGIIIVIIGEIFGLWFIETYLIIPVERIDAARWVFHFSLFTLFINLISVPYNALIIAHERMNIFAWVSIIEVSLKLLIVFSLSWFQYDKLKVYVILVFLLSLIIRLAYGIYCKRNFKASKYKLYWNYSLFKKLAFYALWNLWGNSASVIMVQGVNILLNVFFGPVINAARGIAFQVRTAVYQFVQNFQMAMNPQIIKSYAVDDLKSMHNLIYQGAKISYFLIVPFTIPILLETDLILKIWLKIVPEHTVVFTQLILINVLIDCISGPLMTAAQASGKIKLYQSVVGGLLLFNLPISYLFLSYYPEPEVTFYVSIGISMIALFTRLKIISSLVNLSKLTFLKQVVQKIFIVTILGSILPLALREYCSDGFFRFFLVLGSSFLSFYIAIYVIGLNREERFYIQSKLKTVINKIKDGKYT